MIYKALSVIALLSITSIAYGQNLHIANTVKAQPLVYRGDDGGYKGCGIRVVFMTNVPNPTSIADISINLYNPKDGQPIGLAKALLSDYSDKTNKRIAIDYFMMAKNSGQAIKLLDIKSSEDELALLSSTPWEDSLDLLMDFISSKSTEIGFKMKSEKTLRIFRVTVPPMKIEEIRAFNSCFSGIRNAN